MPGALLTPQGKIVCDFLVHGLEDGVWIDVWSEAADALVKRLSLYRLRADAKIELRGDLNVIVGEGTADPRSSELPCRMITTETAAQDGVGRQSALEIRAGIPAFGRDYQTAEVFPTDVNLDLMGGIGWKKGCFIGQEVLSRMKRRGNIRKRSAGVFAVDQTLERGQSILVDDKPVGTITSADGAIGVALLRLDRFAVADNPATNDGVSLTVQLPANLEN
ncbi:MAG: aminomethyltransferase [Hyphobacterium sp.]|nr:MAG: aminomethyltransferase [Hyphobacterium sp.]